MLDFTLRGLPEHFPDQESRQRALEEIAGEAGNPRSGQFWLAIVLLAAAAFFARWLTGWLLSKVLWPVVLEEIVLTAGMLAGFFVVLRWLHRSGASAELRQRLLASGVPVCLKCGYLLRGLTPSIGRCPECGTAFTPTVRERLTGSDLEAGGANPSTSQHNPVE